MPALNTRTNVDTSVEDDVAFLNMLCAQVKETLNREAKEIKKVTVADYLKLVSLIEERQKASDSVQKEIVVRWEDPSAEIDVSM